MYSKACQLLRLDRRPVSGALLNEAEAYKKRKSKVVAPGSLYSDQADIILCIVAKLLY